MYNALLDCFQALKMMSFDYEKYHPIFLKKLDYADFINSKIPEGKPGSKDRAKKVYFLETLILLNNFSHEQSKEELRKEILQSYDRLISWDKYVIDHGIESKTVTDLHNLLVAIFSFFDSRGQTAVKSDEWEEPLRPDFRNAGGKFRPSPSSVRLEQQRLKVKEMVGRLGETAERTTAMIKNIENAAARREKLRQGLTSSRVSYTGYSKPGRGMLAKHKNQGYFFEPRENGNTGGPATAEDMAWFYSTREAARAANESGASTLPTIKEETPANIPTTVAVANTSTNVSAANLLELQSERSQNLPVGTLSPEDEAAAADLMGGRKRRKTRKGSKARKMRKTKKGTRRH
jgi:hypothetical protein